MANYLAVDSGGTKVAAILFDENFKPLKKARVGSMRANTTSKDLIERNVHSLAEQLDLKEGTVINRMLGICERPFAEYLRNVCVLEDVKGCGELDLGLYAAAICGDGLLSLSGTGATTFYK